MVINSKFLSFVCFLLGLSLFGQNGFCFKYKLVTKQVVTDSLHVFNLNGNSLNQLKKANNNQVTYQSLKLKDKAVDDFIIYPDNTYRQIPDVQLKDYVIKVLGQEEINGYKCTKISLVTFNNGNECYLWISDQLPNYKNYLSTTVLDFKLDRLNTGLAKLNLSGIPVKIAFKVPDYMSYEFVTIAPCDINIGLFDLGRYTKKVSTVSTK
jgi:Domain of unknown function (DUF4412)